MRDRFVMYKDGNEPRGQFEFADGTKSMYVFSREVAYMMNRLHARQGRISPQKAVEIVAEIDKSGLPETVSAGPRRFDVAVFLVKGLCSAPLHTQS